MDNNGTVVTNSRDVHEHRTDDLWVFVETHNKYDET